jgi:conjugative transfer region protein (TIGR03750 family)
MTTTQCDYSSERLNADARLFAGCTLKEMLFLFALNLLVLGILCFTLALLLFNKLLFGCLLLFILIIPCLSFSVFKLGQFKKNKPLFFSLHYLRRKLLRSLGCKDFLWLEHGRYEIRRE